MKNLVKEKLKSGEAVIGTFVQIGHPDVTEILSGIGFDFLLIDAEHSPMGLETLQQLMQAMSGSKCIPMVRPQWNEPVIIKRVLDIGAYGVLIPWVSSREEGEKAVQYCKYPPEGMRGFGPRRAGRFDPDYFKTANEEILVAVQIETEKAVNNIDEILAVPGIDACYVGPADLSVSLGSPNPMKWDEPRLLAAFDRVLDAAKRAKKPAGLYAVHENIEWAIEKGFMFNTVGSADRFLTYGAKAALEKTRNAKKRDKD